jgi:hypothetical protein
MLSVDKQGKKTKWNVGYDLNIREPNYNYTGKGKVKVKFSL